MGDLEFEALFRAASFLAEVDTETLSDRLYNVETEALVVVLADVLPQTKIPTLENILGNVVGEATVHTLPIKLAMGKAETLGGTRGDWKVTSRHAV